MFIILSDYKTVEKYIQAKNLGLSGRQNSQRAVDKFEKIVKIIHQKNVAKCQNLQNKLRDKKTVQKNNILN